MPTPDLSWEKKFGLTTEGFFALIVVCSLLVFIVIAICALQVHRWRNRKKRRQKPARSYTSFSSYDEDEAELSMPGSKVRSFRPPVLEPIEEEELQKLTLGRLEISARYYTHRDKLQIAVKEALLSNVEASLVQNGFLYVTVVLVPDTKNVFETGLVPVAPHVDLDEVCEFDIERSDVVGRSLLVTVCICDRYSKHRTLAEITYNIDRDERADDVVNGELSLEMLMCSEVSRIEPTDHKGLALDDVLIGEILFTLCYMPTAGRLTVVIMKGRSLPLNEDKDRGIVVKVSVICGSKLIRNVQTAPVRKSRSPVYNEAFVFNVAFTKAKETNIVVSVIHEKLNKMIGRIVVGPDSDTTVGRNHWRTAMASPRRPVAQWHSLVQYL